MVLFFATPKRSISPPPELPDADPLLKFDLLEKKQEIFEDVRDRVSSKAQFTRTGRMPWTQVTISLPIQSPTSTEDEDIAVIWSLMKGVDCSEKDNGDICWSSYGIESFWEWLGVDHKNLKPVQKFIHPVNYETGARKVTMLKNKIKKANYWGRVAEVAMLEQELEQATANVNDSSEIPSGNENYHWATVDEFCVTYKKDKQTKKAQKSELQVTLKVRCRYLGNGDPRLNNGYLCGCKNISNFSDCLDPDSDIYRAYRNLGDLI